jgi:hypothetical protein
MLSGRRSKVENTASFAATSFSRPTRNEKLDSLGSKMGASIAASLQKLRSLLKEGWQIGAITLQHHKEEWKSTVVLKRRKGELRLESDDQDFALFCLSSKEFFDIEGTRMFRQIADTGRYYNELKPLTIGFEEESKKAFERLKAGQIRLTFDPGALIREFLRSRAWGDARYLPLKDQYFDVLAAVLWQAKQSADAETRLFQVFPEAERYAKRITELLMKSFDPLNEPLKNYLRFVDLNNQSLTELSRRVLNEAANNKDTFDRLAKDGSVEGHIGLHYLIDMYRRYAEAVRPLLKILSEAVATAEGNDPPDPSLGMSKRVELIQQSSYADIVDCFDPRIRHAASHAAISYDKHRGVVKFEGNDSGGFDDFELTYVEAAEKARWFIRGFVPGVLGTIGMYQELQLTAIVQSGDYRRLLLLIDNEQPLV